MADHVAQRTLVKSPPELWAEVSEERTLAGRLVAFGEIRITRLEPETSVAWEGQDICGTVALEPAGWGTLVTLTVDAPQAAEPETAEQPEDEPEPLPAPEATTRRGWFARLFGRRRPEPAATAAEPTAPDPQPLDADAAPPAIEPAVPDTTALLTAVLDDLGAAHHRPFSRG